MKKITISKLIGVVAPETGLYDFIGLLACGMAASFFVILAPVVYLYDRSLRGGK